MTREEAIFCEKSYIGETDCTDCKYYGTETCKSRESHRMALKALEQEPRKGHWLRRPHVYGVTYCSICDFELKIDNTNYCPHCGAKMESEDEDT